MHSKASRVSLELTSDSELGTCGYFKFPYEKNATFSSSISILYVYTLAYSYIYNEIGSGSTSIRHLVVCISDMDLIQMAHAAAG